MEMEKPPTTERITATLNQPQSQKPLQCFLATSNFRWWFALHTVALGLNITVVRWFPCFTGGAGY